MSRVIAVAMSAILLAACTFDESGIGAVSDGGGAGLDAAAVDAAVSSDAASNTDATPIADARIPDAMVDAASNFNVVEVMIVSCDGTTKTSSTVLSLATTYRLRASGTCQVGVTGGGTPIMSDAEYWDFANPKDLFGTVLPIDRGVAINDSVVDIVGLPNWGAYALGHVYAVNLVGLQTTITATFYDNVYSNNLGSITVEIMAPN